MDDDTQHFGPAVDASESPQPPAPPRRIAGDVIRILLWLMWLIVVVTLAGILAYAGAVLAVFGLSGLALVLAAALLGVTAVAWRRGMLPAAVLAAALALPAAQVALGETRFDRSAGSLLAMPLTPHDVEGRTFRRGFGSVLVDLRNFHALDGSVTRIRARADNGNVVVALPRDRCFNLELHTGSDRSRASEMAAFVRAGADLTGISSLNLDANAFDAPSGLAHRTLVREQSASAENARDWSVLLYGRNPPAVGHAQRVVPGRDGARRPTLRLELQANQQVVVRDYPTSAAPLSRDTWGSTGGTSWPAGLTAPRSPEERSPRWGPATRTPENRARWLKWERDVVAWGAAQSKRFAGACATASELRDRAYAFDTQPEAVRLASGGVGRVRGAGGKSTVPQRVAARGQTMVHAEVNGLGEVKAIPAPAPEDESGMPVVAGAPGVFIR